MHRTARWAATAAVALVATNSPLWAQEASGALPANPPSPADVPPPAADVPAPVTPAPEPAAQPTVVTPVAPPAAADAAKDGGAKKDAGKTDWWVPALFGDPTPYSRRPPSNRFLTFETDLKYALVGTGPTRFVNDIRFSVVDWVEFGTQLGPVIIPERLTMRVNAGFWKKMGRIGFEGGFHKLDVGLRLFPEEGEDRGFNPNIVPSINAVGAVTYDLPIWDRFSIHFSARAQQRMQHSLRGVLDGNFKDPLDQFAFQLAAQGTWDITSQLSMTVGTAYGTAIDNRMFKDVFNRARNGTAPWDDPELPRLDWQKGMDRRDPFSVLDTRGKCGENKTRTLFVDFVETARPGYATLVDRDNNCSLSFSGALTYGRTESFDVDLFGALRAWPTMGGLFGAGIRWRIGP